MLDAQRNVGIDPVASVVTTIAREATAPAAFGLLSRLVDDIGPRPAGSAAAAAAVGWATASLAERGVRAWLEEVHVPHWIRGEEKACIAGGGPALALLGLGGSVSTPPQGLEAEVVMVRSLEEIDQLGERIRGKIVLVNRPMDMALVRRQRAFEAYREVNPLRVRGPSRAARHGAAAFLIRSLGSANYRLPHAGMLSYEDGVTAIPAAALAAEDAELIERLLARGQTVRVQLRLCETRHADVASANVVAEVQGRDAGDEYVLAGAHLDTWDVSPGAHDNGAGVVMVIEALRILSLAGLRPKRTVRGVLFMSEEIGSQGGIAYHRAHRHDKVTAVVETDHGAAAPIGFDTSLSAARSAGFAPLLEALEAGGILAPLEGRGARFEQQSATGVDTAPFRADGIPGFGLMPDPRGYFDLHHTAADTLDKVDASHLARCVTAFTALVWFLAERGISPGEVST